MCSDHFPTSDLRAKTPVPLTESSTAGDGVASGDQSSGLTVSTLTIEASNHFPSSFKPTGVYFCILNLAPSLPQPPHMCCPLSSLSSPPSDPVENITPSEVTVN